VDAYLVSADDAFLIEAGPAFSDRFRTRSIDDLADLPDPSENKNWLVVLDTASLSDARATVGALEQRIAGRPIIVVVPDGDTTDWRLVLSRGTVIDAVPRQDLLQPRFATALLNAEERVHAAPGPIPAGPRDTAPSLRPLISIALTPLVGGALAFVGLAAIVGVWLHLRSRITAPVAPGAVPAPTAAAPTANPATTATGNAPSVTELLSAARVAFANPRTVLPRVDADTRGQSALELYRQVLTQDPANDEAVDGIARTWALGRARIQADVGAGKLDEAVQLLAAFKGAAVDSREMDELEAAIAAARPHWLVTRAQQSIAAGDLAAAEQLVAQLVASGADSATVLDLRRTLDARKTDAQLTAMARDVRTALDAGALLDPASDNADTRIQAMRQISRTSTLTLNAQRDVQAALLASAQDATRKAQFELAQRLIAAAVDLGPTAATAEAKRALQAELDASAQRAAAAAAAAESARLAASSSAEPAPKPAPANEVIAAKPVRALDVEYPKLAADANLSGYVVVEFTLQRNGQAAGARVIEANPPKTFDASALSAVSGGRFDTSHLLNNQPQRARIKVSFAASAQTGVHGPTVAPPIAPPVPVAPPDGNLVAAKPVRPLDVSYPDAAAVAKIQGYVIVEFMLQHDGRAEGAHVVEASPAGIFDANALAAVSRGRFDTSSLVNGQAQRARIKLGFKSS
jgi:TonB family protein